MLQGPVAVADVVAPAIPALIALAVSIAICAISHSLLECYGLGRLFTH